MTAADAAVVLAPALALLAYLITVSLAVRRLRWRNDGHDGELEAVRRELEAVRLALDAARPELDAAPRELRAALRRAAIARTAQELAPRLRAWGETRNT